MNKTRLILGKSLPLADGFEIRQTTMDEIALMDEGLFDSYLAPFVLTIDALFENEEEADKIRSQFTMFQLFFHKVDESKYLLDSVFGGRNSLEFLSEVIAFFLDIDVSNITILHNRKKFAISDGERELVVDDEMYNKLRKMIQFMTSREDVEIERPPKNMTDRQKDIWTKLQAGRKRREQREALSIADMVNIVALGGRSYISFGDIGKMTYYQFRRAYTSVIARDNFDLSMGYKLSQKFDVKDEVRHWAKDFKV